jgi:hypothetical protein
VIKKAFLSCRLHPTHCSNTFSAFYLYGLIIAPDVPCLQLFLGEIIHREVSI